MKLSEVDTYRPRPGTVCDGCQMGYGSNFRDCAQCRKYRLETGRQRAEAGIAAGCYSSGRAIWKRQADDKLWLRL